MTPKNTTTAGMTQTIKDDVMGLNASNLKTPTPGGLKSQQLDLNKVNQADSLIGSAAEYGEDEFEEEDVHMLEYKR